MNKALLLVLFCLPLLLSAQHWAPVKMGERYNYRQAPADVITQTLWADSMKVVNGDSVWYMNRTIRKCDTCSQFWVFYGNQPFFLGKKVIKKADGHYLLISEDTMDIQAFRQQGDRWVFHDTTIATVDSVWAEHLFGQLPDSFKSIALSNSGEIHISKRNGIIYWNMPDDSAYTLVGLQGLVALGEQVPMYEDFYGDGYTVSDVIEWSETGGGVMFEPIYATVHRAQIIGIDTLPNDTLALRMLYWKRVGERYVWCQGIISSPYDDFYCSSTCSPQVITRKIIPRRLNPSDGWPGQLVYSGQPFFEKEEEIEPRYALCLLAKTEEGEIIKFAGKSPYFDCLKLSRNSYRYISQSGYDRHEINWTGMRSGVLVEQYPFWGNIYHQGIGLQNWSYLFFEGQGGGALLGHIHNGDTTGTILPESYWWPTGLAPEGEQLAFSIYPNPAQGRFSIKLPDNQHPAQVRLVNLLGQKQKEWKVPPGIHEGYFELDKTIAPGLYLVEVEQDGRRGSRMLQCAF